MRARSLSHLSDAVLLRNTTQLLGRNHENTAELLLHLAEVDARKLFVPAGYPSMHAFCVGYWHMSDDEAYKRLQVARAGRAFPALFDAIAEGKLHLTAVVLLAPHLTPGNADELLEMATHRTVTEIKELLARRFPRSESLPLVTALTPPQAGRCDADVQETSCQLVSKPVEVPRARVEPVAPERYMLQLTMGRRMREKLQYAQELMSHQSLDVAAVLERGLDALISKIEKRKLGATDKPRRIPRPVTAKRTIPADVKRAVWQRDGGRCTYTNEHGHRCPARTRIEFDHIVPVARGGEATVEDIRLRCHAHNQFAAEQAFGAGFMEQKREEAQRAAEERRRDSHERQRAAANGARTGESQESDDKDVVPWLRQLGFRADESREAAKLCDGIPDATLEQRVRRALSYFRPRFEHRSQIASRREA